MSAFTKSPPKSFITNLLNTWYNALDKILSIRTENYKTEQIEIETRIKTMEENFHEVLINVFIDKGGMAADDMDELIQNNIGLLEPIKIMVTYYYDIKLGRPSDSPIIELNKQNDTDGLKRFYIYFMVEILCSDYSTEKYETHSEDELTFEINKCKNEDSIDDNRVANLTATEINEKAESKSVPNASFREGKRSIPYDRVTERSPNSIKRDEELLKKRGKLLSKRDPKSKRIADLLETRSNRYYNRKSGKWTRNANDNKKNERAIKEQSNRRKIVLNEIRGMHSGGKKSRKTKKNKKINTKNN